MTVEIRYSCSCMEIRAGFFLNSRNATVKAFRRLIRLSVQSDLLYGTCAVSQWKEALATEQSNLCMSQPQKKKLDRFMRIFMEEREKNEKA